MIVVTTPTGNIGSSLVEKLLANNENLVLLARQPEKLSLNLHLQTEVRQGSTDDADFMKTATAGAQALFLCIPPVYQTENLRESMLKFANAAVAAINENEIAHVVFVSSGGKGVENAGAISILHEIEELLSQTEASVAFLRAGFFMENFFNFLESILRDGAIYAPARGDLRLPLIATEDIAAKASQLLTNRNWSGKFSIPLHGAEDLSLNEAAQILGAALGKEIRFVTVPETATKQFLLSKGMSENLVRETLNMYRAFGNGSIYDAEPRTTETTTPTTLAGWAREVFVPQIAGISG